MATELGCSESQVARILLGGVGVNPSDSDKLLTFFEVTASVREELTRPGGEAGRR